MFQVFSEECVGLDTSIHVENTLSIVLVYLGLLLVGSVHQYPFGLAPSGGSAPSGSARLAEKLVERPLQGRSESCGSPGRSGPKVSIYRLPEIFVLEYRIVSRFDSSYKDHTSNKFSPHSLLVPVYIMRICSLPYIREPKNP